MRPTTRVRSRFLPALLTTVVAAIVLGILGMHALNTHGVASNTDHATAAMPMPATHADMPAARGDHPAAGSRNDIVVTAPDPAGGHDMGDMVMLCIAMLAAAAGALLLLVLLRRVPRLWAHLPAAPLTLTKRLTARLGTGPPPVWEYSVIRC